MGLKNGTPDAASYREFYQALHTDEAKLRFLMMLKERRDRHSDPVATKILPEIVQKWIDERFSA